MPRIIFAILLVLMALIQTTVLPMGHFIGLTPDLVLVSVLLWSATREPREGLVWAFGIGLFLDLLTLSPLGSTALALLPVAVTGWLSRSRFFQSGLLFPLLMAMAATLVHGIALLMLAPLTGSHLNIVAAARLATLGALLNAVVVPPLYLIVQLLDRWIGRNDTYARA
jgi:rod shape-determining protein MreD